MAHINLAIYPNLKMYAADICQSTELRDISWSQLKWAAISLGGFSYRFPSKRVTQHYESLLSLLLDEASRNNDTFYTISDDYAHAETSFKTSFSFFIGMIMAKVFAVSELKVPLLHLSDLAISATSSTKSRPDFFGFKGTQGFLVEAKGTSGSGIDAPAIEKALKQIEAISSVSFTNSSHTFTNSSLKGYAIRGCFTGDASSQIPNILTCQAIDPSPNGSASIQIDPDAAFQSYYSAILPLSPISIEESEADERTSSRMQGILHSYPGYSFSQLGTDLIGIRNDIREVLSPSNPNNSKIPKQASKSLIDIWNSNEAVSYDKEQDVFMGPDGIIVAANACE